MHKYYIYYIKKIFGPHCVCASVHILVHVICIYSDCFEDVVTIFV